MRITSARKRYAARQIPNNNAQTKARRVCTAEQYNHEYIHDSYSWLMTVFPVVFGDCEAPPPHSDPFASHSIQSSHPQSVKMKHDGFLSRSVNRRELLVEMSLVAQTQ